VDNIVEVEGTVGKGGRSPTVEKALKLSRGFELLLNGRSKFEDDESGRGKYSGGSSGL
jgi:hypothetical protein